MKTDPKAAPAMLDHLHGDAALVLINGGLLVRDPELEAHVGRNVRFHSWVPSMGTQTRDFTFRIVGTQRDWSGRHCWRVLCNDGHDTFGRVAHPSEVVFCDDGRTGPADPACEVVNP